MASLIPAKPETTFFISASFGRSPPIAWLKDRDGEIAYILRNPVGEMMVVRKSYYPKGILRLPTGGVEGQESPCDTLIREVKEETGIDVRKARYVLRVDYRLSLDGVDKPFQTHCFIVDVKSERPRIVDEHQEHEEHRWIDRKGLVGLVRFFEGYRGDWKDYCKFRVILHKAVLEKVL